MLEAADTGNGPDLISQSRKLKTHSDPSPDILQKAQKATETSKLTLLQVLHGAETCFGLPAIRRDP